MIDLGIVRPGSTIRIPFSSFDKDDGSAITMTNFAVADILVYKDGGTTERASTSGYTATTDFDGKTGKHLAIIDLADNTTAGFWNAGSEYLIAIDSVTIDAVTTGGWIARFRIGQQGAWFDTTIATLSSQTSFTLTAGPAEDDAINGCSVIIHDIASAVQCGLGIVSDYTGSTKTVTLAAGTTFTAAAGDNISIMFPQPMQPTVAGRTLDVSTGGEAGVDWANVGSPTTVVGLSGTTVKTATDVETDTADIQSRLPAALVSGRIDASVGAMAAGVLTATAIAADAITDAKVAADVTIASVTGAVGSVTGNVGGNVSGSVGSVTARVTANTDQLAGQTVTAAAGVTFPTSVASPTNITAGTITTVTNLTNAPTAGDFTATMKTSIGTAVAASAVASVTGNVGGNVTGSVGSLAAQAKADVNAEVDAALADVRLDELLAADSDIDGAAPPTVGSVFHELMTKTTGSFTYDQTTDSLEAVRDRGDAAWTTATGFSTLDAAGVRSAVGLATNDLDTQLAALPTAAENADAVWEEAIADHSGTTGSTAEALGAAGAAGDPWTTLLPGSYGAGSAGKIIGDNINATISSRATQTSVDDLPTNAELATALGTADDATLAAIAALNNLSQADVRSAIGLASANLDTQLDTLPTAAENATSVWGAATRILTAGTNIVLAKGTGITGFNDLSAAQVNAEADTALADAGVTTTVTGRIDAAISTRATQTSVDTVDDFVDTEVAAIKGVTDKLNTALELDGAVYRFTTNALEQAPSGSLTVQAIVDGVLDEATSAHQTAGTVGKAITDAQSAGDPWASELETGVTASTMLRAAAAVAAGKTDITELGGGAATVVFRDISDSSDLITATMADSERTAVTVAP